MKRPLKLIVLVSALLMATIVAFPMKSLDILASDAVVKGVSVLDGGALTHYRTAAATVGAFLSEQRIYVGSKDSASHAHSNALENGMVISIARAVNVTVSVDGILEKKRVPDGTTIERLTLALQADWDKALTYEGDAGRLVVEGERIEFYSWESEILVLTEPIMFDSYEFETTALLMDRSYVRQYGVQGEMQYVVAVVSVGGNERKREIIDEYVVTEPIPEIIDVGVGGKLGTTTDTSSPSFVYVKKYTMNASAYTNGYESTRKNPDDPGYGITKSGVKTQRGIVSVDPSVIPLGTRLYVEGYGYALAADVGSAIVGHRIDLFYENLDEALRFGRRSITVYVLE